MRNGRRGNVDNLLLDLSLPADCVDFTQTGVGRFAARYGFLEKPARIRFRILDSDIKVMPGVSCADITLDADNFSRMQLDVRRIFITENETNFLAFPSVPCAMVIFGSGYGWDALAKARWLDRCEAWYWGDIDTHGFAILDQLREHFPRIASFENTHVHTPNGASFRLLKSAAIYGPNAGGKSNLLQALGFLRRSLISRRITDRPDPEDEYEKRPFFKLDTTSKDIPSEFEVTFMDKGVRYQYGFSLLWEKVIEEWLLVYMSDKPQEWFRRSIDKATGEDVYKFSTYFKGQKETWKKSTRKEALFLAVAAELNSEQLRPVYHWLLKLEVLDRHLLYKGFIDVCLIENEHGKKILLDFLTAADLGITDIRLRTEIRKIMRQSNINGSVSAGFVEREFKRPVFIHRHDEINEYFELNEESEGTQRMFLLASYVLCALNSGTITLIDELEDSLHPSLARFIIGLFNSAENKRGAQLIFSTHNTGLLDIKETFRRDQIWFAEKNSSRATVLNSLADFYPRKDANVESGYLTGRYGAVPFVTEFTPNYGESGDGAR